MTKKSKPVETHKFSCLLVQDHGDCTCKPESACATCGLATSDGTCPDCLRAAPGVAPANASEHTPGPWIVGLLNSRDNTLDVVCDNGTDCYNKKQHVASVSPVGEWSRGSQGANARLIASAPELLDAVKDYANDLREGVGGTWTLERLKKVIAKAEGR